MKIIGESSGCIEDPWRENSWANLILDGIRDQTGSDFAMTKAMMVFPVHSPGPVRRFDIECTVPGLGWFERNGFDRIVKIELPGTDIRSIMEHAVSDATVNPANCTLTGGTRWPRRSFRRRDIPDIGGSMTVIGFPNTAGSEIASNAWCRMFLQTDTAGSFRPSTAGCVL